MQTCIRKRNVAEGQAGKWTRRMQTAGSAEICQLPTHHPTDEIKPYKKLLSSRRDPIVVSKTPHKSHEVRPVERSVVLEMLAHVGCHECNKSLSVLGLSRFCWHILRHLRVYLVLRVAYLPYVEQNLRSDAVVAEKWAQLGLN